MLPSFVQRLTIKITVGAFAEVPVAQRGQMPLSVLVSSVSPRDDGKSASPLKSRFETKLGIASWTMPVANASIQPHRSEFLSELRFPLEISNVFGPGEVRMDEECGWSKGRINCPSTPPLKSCSIFQRRISGGGFPPTTSLQPQHPITTFHWSGYVLELMSPYNFSSPLFILIIFAYNLCVVGASFVDIILRKDTKWQVVGLPGWVAYRCL
jgi:hypothetical protein